MSTRTSILASQTGNPGFRAAPKKRARLRLDLDAVRRAAMAEGMSADQVEARIRELVAERGALDAPVRTAAAMALAREEMAEIFGDGSGG